MAHEFIMYWHDPRYDEELNITAEIYAHGRFMRNEYYHELLEDPEWHNIRIEDAEGEEVHLEKLEMDSIRDNLSELYWDQEPWNWV